MLGGTSRPKALDVEGATAVTPTTSSRASWAFRLPPAGQGGGGGSSPVSMWLNSAETEAPLHRIFNGDTFVLEDKMTGAVIGVMPAIPGRSPRRSLHPLVRLFRDPRSANVLPSRSAPSAQGASVEEPGRVRIATPNSRR